MQESPAPMSAAHRRILLVDSDALPRRALAEQIGGQSDVAEVRESANGAEGLELAVSGTWDTILLADPLADMEAEDACRLLRARGVACPVLVLAAEDRGLPAGADALMVKPFRLAALLARIRTTTRLQTGTESERVALGPYEFDPGLKLLRRHDDGSAIRLTEKESAILAFLIREDAPVSRDRLLAEVWGYGSGLTTHTLETHIYRLRKKIEPVPGRITLLLTQDGGYRLNP